MMHPSKNLDAQPAPVPFTQRAKVSTASDFPIVDITISSAEYTEIETEILEFCQ